MFAGLRCSSVTVLAALAVACAAEAGTTWIDFESGVGPLAPSGFSTGPGTLTASSGRASFSDQNVTYLVNESGMFYAAVLGTGEASITFCPQTDAGNGVGLQIGMEGSPGSIWYSILAASDGTVTVSDGWHGIIGTASFPNPTAPDCTLTWSNDGDPTGLWVLLNGVPKINLSSYPITSLWALGVRADGPAGFGDFRAHGDGIPDYPPAGARKGIIAVSPPGWIEAGMRVIFTAPDGSAWQWRRNGVPILDAAAVTLIFDAVTTADAGTYDVLYDDASKAVVTSYPVVLEVLPEGSLPVAWWPAVPALPMAWLALASVWSRGRKRE